ncbi:hypothetical protein EXM22_08960 [Oceanispirochaeta crateris]|uniref:hydroxyethylthiazole kinase n=1 Tax=Oceanispirochaeta crateris TaxID=2518645 RepID=A0A5C1QLL3_9SPIO|nr:hydroxyethylthiazole kinase [Oceanispirochaeta crateris]QEN08109.1 hypothetical protein EXM22_08960 [Oceanispirochaeta crateris]
MVYKTFLKAINQSRPIIHVLMNNVTNLFVADALLALGCKPIMAFDARETAGVTIQSDGLCINTGTPHRHIQESYNLSLRSALRNKIPLVLDFPGVGSSPLRQDIAFQLLSILKEEDPDNLVPRIIRGNASEIYCLADGKSHGGSIDSIHNAEDVAGITRGLRSFASALCISGPENYILGQSSSILRGGHALMSRISGFGCVSSALMAAFLSCCSEFHTHDFSADAAAGVCSFMSECSSRITEINGPADFKLKFIDQIYNITEESNDQEVLF